MPSYLTWDREVLEECYDQVDGISLHAYTADGVRMLEDLGVTDVIVGFRDPYHMPDTPVGEKIDYLRRYADDVIASVR